MKWGMWGLQEVIEEQALTFVSYDTWTDAYEGYLVKAINKRDGFEMLKEVFDRLEIEMHPKMFHATMQLLKRARHFQSWTSGPEREEMWRIYSPERTAVRVRTSALKVWQAQVEALPIVYVESISIEDEVRRILTDKGSNLDFINIFTRKIKKRFEFEEEVRLVTDDCVMFPGSTSKTVAGRPDLRKVDISRIPDFIESVMVDPEASAEHVAAVQAFCEAKGIAFEGKSRLNELIVK
jgi:hypothetical protein